MKTNLIFKRQVTNNGVSTVETKIIPVDIVGIERGAGWTLSGHTDTIEIVKENTEPAITSGTQITFDDINNSESAATEKKITKFVSDVPGTAKLVNTKGVIKIVARRGKTTYNQTRWNSVCIDDFRKTEFFNHCKELFGVRAGIYEISDKQTKAYDYWRNFLAQEYEQQLQRYKKSLGESK